MYRGTRQQFLVVAAFDDYAAPMTQADFDRMAREWPTYGQLRLNSSDPRAQKLQVSHGGKKG